MHLFIGLTGNPIWASLLLSMMDQNILDTKKKPVSELIGDYDIAVITARDAPMGVESVPR